MNKSSCRKSVSSSQRGMVLACAMALGILAVSTGAAQAQNSAPAADRSHITNSTNSGSQVWRNGYGECWHSGFGPAPAPSAECDPNYRAPVPQAVAPEPKRAELPPPAPLVVAPAPAPAVVAALPPARMAVVERVSLDADALFDFDKAVLRPEGRSTLDGFVSKLNDVDVEKITAIGHTDRFGTDRYNQSLSKRRAAAVKDYLVAKGVRSDRVSAQGVGETQPVMKVTDCRGPKSAKVVACLQPDRRVDIDLVGSRTTR